MLVYVVSSLMGMNGADRVAVEILSSLVNTNLPITVISDEKCELPPEYATRSTSPLNWISSPRNFSFPKSVDRFYPRRMAKWIKWSLLDVRMRSQIRKIKPDLTLVNAFGNHDLWRRLELGAGGKTALIVHESPRTFGGEFRARNLAWALNAMETYSHLIFVSSHCRNEWHTYSSLAGKETFYIPNCCREDEVLRVVWQDRAAIRRRLGLPTDRFVAVCVASIQYHKGQDLLVNNFADLLDVVPDLMIYLIGNTINATDWTVGSREYAAQLAGKIEERGFSDRVLFCGPRNDALDFIYAADMLVLPSRSEGMPLTVLEAMALGTPVVASNVDGLSELIESNVSGLLFELEKPSELVEAFARMAADSDARRSFAERASQRYWNNFSREHFIKRYLQVVEKILAN